MKSIHGYEITRALTSENAGFSQWGFCRKDGHEYFIKEFVEIKYPIDRSMFSPEAYERKIKICEKFYDEKCRLYKALEKCRTGNNMIVQNFFREGSRYYTVTDKVCGPVIGVKEVALLSSEKKEVLFKSILYSISALHRAGIVHSDIKADNILLQETFDRYVTAKIIDFDAGFLLNEPQNNVKGDFVYLSPEAFLKMNGENINLTEKIDIFALGILFHQYYTGDLPLIPKEDSQICTAVLNCHEVILYNTLPSWLRDMIKKMLSLDPADRPDASSLLQFLQNRSNPVSAPASNASNIPEQLTLKKKGFYVPTNLR